MKEDTDKMVAVKITLTSEIFKFPTFYDSQRQSRIQSLNINRIILKRLFRIKYKIAIIKKNKQKQRKINTIFNLKMI